VHRATKSSPAVAMMPARATFFAGTIPGAAVGLHDVLSVGTYLAQSCH